MGNVVALDSFLGGGDSVATDATLEPLGVVFALLVVLTTDFVQFVDTAQNTPRTRNSHPLDAHFGTSIWKM